MCKNVFMLLQTSADPPARFTLSRPSLVSFLLIHCRVDSTTHCPKALLQEPQKPGSLFFCSAGAVLP